MFIRFIQYVVSKQKHGILSQDLPVDISDIIKQAILPHGSK